MLKIGEKIHSDVTRRTYTVTWASDKITQAEVGFASTPTDGEVYFIKRLLCMKYPTESSLGSPALKAERRKMCDEHFRKYSYLYKSIKAGCGSDGACVPIEDYFREGAFYYTVYQKINAESLSLEEIASLDNTSKYKLLLRLVQGLQPMHTQGVIHGDLKPDNILVQRDGANWRIRLIDMNDCYHAGEPNAPGEVIGTPDYYSPELTTYNTYEVEDFEDDEEMAYVRKLAAGLTTKSDIFALGIIFCEFFTGERPIINSEEIEHIAEASIKGCLEYPKGIPAGFKSILTSMLASNPKERPSLTVLADKLKNLMSGVVKLCAPSIVILSKDSTHAEIKIDADGAVKIFYTIDGSTPTSSSMIYDSVINVTKTTTIKCVAQNEECKFSPISQQTINIGRLLFKVSSKEPTIKVNGREITIKPNALSNKGTVLYFTTDGSRPTTSSTVYERPFIVAEDVSKVSAVSKEPEENKMLSNIVSATVYKERLRKPIIHFKKGLVTMESTDFSAIYYTLDGSSPSSESIKYVSPFYVDNVKKFCVKAICSNGDSLDSEESIIKRPNLKMS